VTSWEQRTGHLLVGGDSRFIRAWDARIECPVYDFPTQAGSNCTAITSDHIGGNVFVAGFGDGVIRIFDKRLGDERAIVRVIRQHHTWIKNVTMQKGDGQELVTGRWVYGVVLVTLLIFLQYKRRHQDLGYSIIRHSPVSNERFCKRSVCPRGT
jgi:WD40 repeat protein